MGGAFDRVHLDPLTETEGDVFGDRSREEHDVLLDRRDLRAKRRQVPFPDVDAVDQDAALVDIIDAGDQLGQRALAGAGFADDRDRFARCGAERDVVQDRIAAVAERDIVEDDLAGDRAQRDRLRSRRARSLHRSGQDSAGADNAELDQ